LLEFFSYQVPLNNTAPPLNKLLGQTIGAPGQAETGHLIDTAVMEALQQHLEIIIHAGLDADVPLADIRRKILTLLLDSDYVEIHARRMTDEAIQRVVKIH